MLLTEFTGREESLRKCASRALEAGRTEGTEIWLRDCPFDSASSLRWESFQPHLVTHSSSRCTPLRQRRRSPKGKRVAPGKSRISFEVSLDSPQSRGGKTESNDLEIVTLRM